MRTHMLQRWNWSPKAEKWVYVKLKNGKRIYKYQKETPNHFNDVINQLQVLNLKLLDEEDPDKNAAIYKKMMELSQQLQAMKD